MKDCPDVQVISFNVDEELGLVEPFCERTKLHVSSAARLRSRPRSLDDFGIPENWLVDTRGKWIAIRLGFDPSDADWVGTMTKLLENARLGKSPTGSTE